MAEIRYVVVCSDGTSYDLSRRKPFSEWGTTKKPQYDLQDLLEQGWTAIREIGMGGGERMAYALVVVERKAAESAAAPNQAGA